MEAKQITVGMEVTWGTGNIRGRVTDAPFNDHNPESGEVEPFIRCSLTKPYKTPCGMTIPKGTPIAVPVSEARSLS